MVRRSLGADAGRLRPEASGKPAISEMVPRERLELPTCGLGNRCSVLLSYRGTGVPLREAAYRGQLRDSGGMTGNGSGITFMPSSFSSFAVPSVACP